MAGLTTNVESILRRCLGESAPRGARPDGQLQRHRIAGGVVVRLVRAEHRSHLSTAEVVEKLTDEHDVI